MTDLLLAVTLILLHLVALAGMAGFTRPGPALLRRR